MVVELLLIALASMLVMVWKRRYNTNVGDMKVKPYSSIPGPWGLPILGRFWDFLPGGRYDYRFHCFLEDLPKQYGPISRQNTFGLHIVVLSNVALIQEMMEKDDRYPHIFLSANKPWHMIRRFLGAPLGLRLSGGKEWKRIRSPWNHTMLNTAQVYTYLPQLNSVQCEFIGVMKTELDDHGFVPNLDKLLVRWALECANMFIFETRLGCLTQNENPEAEELIENIMTMFETSWKLTTNTMFLSKIFNRRVYQDCIRSWKAILNYGMKIVDARILEVSTSSERETNGFLCSVIASKQLSTEELYTCVSELLMNSFDTVSNTMQLVLYELSRNPGIQNKLYDEILTVTNGALPTADHLRKMEYLKATIREVLRVYPTGMVASRVLNEPKVIGGYHIPAGVCVMASAYSTGRMEELFEEPLSIKPERWLQSGADISRYASHAFGLGVRGCIGQQMAGVEMQTLIVQLLQKFELHYCSDKPIELYTRPSLNVLHPPKIKFTLRT